MNIPDSSPRASEGTMSRSDPLRDMADALIESPDDIDPRTFRTGMATLQRHLQRRYAPGLSVSDIEDVAAAAAAQLYRAAVRGNTHAIDNPAGYLVIIASRLAQAHGKEKHRQIPVTSGVAELLTDDQAAAQLDRVATADVVQRAMNTARRGGDATALQVATYMLDTLQQTGTTPSSRVVGEALGLSHTGVAKAMARLRRYIVNSAAL